jgi:CRP/FNR family transcriptional regulator, cyclic AMP receptor protein
MNRYISNIRSVNLFAAMKDEQIEAISKITMLKTYPKNYVIFQEGERGDALFIIVKGKVKVLLYGEDGREYILDMIGPDGFFGELSLIDELPRSANVMTVEESELLMIRRSDFIRLLMENPAMTISILKILSRRLRAADERIKGLAFLSVEGRILKYLMEIGEESGVKVKDHLVIEKGPTQIEIANSCGCSRETVSRMVKSMIEKGIISVRKRSYTIHLSDISF